MLLSKVRFITCSALSLGMLIFTQPIFAQQFTPPEQISQSGHVYKLAYKQVAPNGSAIYEYTTNEEPVEKWTTLITLNYNKNIKIDPLKWTTAMKTAMEASMPKRNSKSYISGNIVYASFIIEPDIKNKTYESNVHKIFHLGECGGLLVYQYAVKYPQIANQSDAEKLNTLNSINKELESLSTDVERSEWIPVCN